jgi:hypothetical protein
MQHRTSKGPGPAAARSSLARAAVPAHVIRAPPRKLPVLACWQWPGRAAFPAAALALPSGAHRAGSSGPCHIPCTGSSFRRPCWQCPVPQFLHCFYRRPCWQWPEPQSLHMLFGRHPCWQACPVPQSLHWFFRRPCWQWPEPQSLHMFFGRPRAGSGPCRSPCTCSSDARAGSGPCHQLHAAVLARVILTPGQKALLGLAARQIPAYGAHHLGCPPFGSRERVSIRTFPRLCMASICARSSAPPPGAGSNSTAPASRAAAPPSAVTPSITTWFERKLDFFEHFKRPKFFILGKFCIHPPGGQGPRAHLIWAIN